MAMHETMWSGTGNWMMMIFWWVVSVLVMAFSVFWILKRPPKKGENGNALSILNERYAKGEISKEEYEEKKKNIFSQVS